MTAEQIPQFLKDGVDHLSAGRFDAAEPLFRDVLRIDSNQPDALHYLGVVTLHRGQVAAAAELIYRSIQIAPNFAAYNNLGAAMRALGRVEDAIKCYDRSAQLNSNHPDALFWLGALLAGAVKHEPAVNALSRLVHLQPDHPNANLMLGTSLAELHYYERAISAFKAQIRVTPENAEAHGRLSSALSTLNRHDPAIAAARKSVELLPEHFEAHNNLGWVLNRAGKLEESESSYRRAIEIKPDFVMALGNLASSLEKRDEFDDALEMFERACRADPKHIDALCALAGMYAKHGRYEEALEFSEKALAINPHWPAAHGQRSLSLLAFGRYEEGFAEYEWRWKCHDFTSPNRDFEQPMWRGADPTGRTILIHCEQGYGDNIQFARYLPMLAARGAKVIVEAPIALRRVMETVPGISRVIAAGVRPPPFDLHAPLLSLPHAFKTTLANIPSEIPYFSVPPDVVDSWRQRLAGRLGKFNVGLLWRGKTRPNPKRSIPLPLLAPLAAVGDVTFVSLAVAEHGDEARRPPEGMRLIDLSREMQDFLDTAAVLKLLDLVITIDSGPAHLAGALGIPTWTLLIRAADWRWLQDRGDSPWYPSMRLFSQCVADDWAPVIDRVAAELCRTVP